MRSNNSLHSSTKRINRCCSPREVPTLRLTRNATSSFFKNWRRADRLSWRRILRMKRLANTGAVRHLMNVAAGIERIYAGRKACPISRKNSGRGYSQPHVVLPEPVAACADSSPRLIDSNRYSPFRICAGTGKTIEPRAAEDPGYPFRT